MDPADLWKRFAPVTGTPPSIEGIQLAFHDLAAYLNLSIPDGREKSLMMTKLEKACFFAVAAKERE